MEVTNLISSRTALERPTIAGDSPVGKRDSDFRGVLEYHGAR